VAQVFAFGVRSSAHPSVPVQSMHDPLEPHTAFAGQSADVRHCRHPPETQKGDASGQARQSVPQASGMSQVWHPPGRQRRPVPQDSALQAHAPATQSGASPLQDVQAVPQCAGSSSPQVAQVPPSHQAPFPQSPASRQATHAPETHRGASTGQAAQVGPQAVSLSQPVQAPSMQYSAPHEVAVQVQAPAAHTGRSVGQATQPAPQCAGSVSPHRSHAFVSGRHQ